MAFTILDTYPPKTAHNTCYFCRAAQRQVGNRLERVVDTMIFIDYEGYVVFCESCATEVAILLGMAPAQKVDELKARIAELEATTLELKNTATLAEDVNTSIRRWAGVIEKEAASE